MTPMVEKNRIVRIKRLAFMQAVALELVDTNVDPPRPDVHIRLSTAEFALIAACYETMKHQRDVVLMERDPNVYDFAHHSQTIEPSNSMTFEQWFASVDESHDPATRRVCQLAWIAAKRSDRL